MTTKKLLTAILLVTAIQGLPAFAADEGAVAPVMDSTKGASFLSGGIGLDERASMRSSSRDYNLQLLFAVRGGGEYLASNQVSIQDRKGNKVIDTKSEGPWFFAKLPAGRYKVSVGQDGKAQTRNVNLTASGHTKMSFYLAE